MERTLIIVKPNATASGVTGAVTTAFEDAGLRVVARRRIRLSAERAQAFYAEHRERPFFASLVAFMTSGPVEPMVLEGDDAVARARALLGATDPAKAEKGAIRERFGESLERNAAHGSDSLASAEREIAFFFAPDDIVG